MKKLLLLGLITSFAFSEVYYNNKEKSTYKNDRINFEGTIYNISNYREYSEVTIATKENGRIKTKINSNYFKEGQKVKGSCENYEYGMYNSCVIY